MRVRVEGEGEWEFPDDATEGEIAVAINGERGLGPRGVPEFAGRPAGFQPETSGPALLPRSGPDLRPEAARSRPAFSAGLGVPIAQPVEPPAGSPPAAVAPPPAAGTLPAGGSTLRPGSLVPQNPFAPRPNPMRTALAGMQAAAGAPLAAFGPEAIQAAGAAAAPPLPRTEGPSAFEGTPAALGAGVVDVARSVTAMPRVAARLGEGLADAVLGEAAGALVRKLGAIAPQRVVGDFLDEKLLKPATEFYEGNEGMRRDAREAPLSEKLQEPGWAARQAVRQLPQLAAALATAGAGPAAGAAGKGGTLLSRVLAGAAATGKQIAAPAVLEAGETTRNLEEEEARTGQRLDNLRFGTAVAGKGVAAGALELAGAEAILGKLAKYAPDAVKRRLGKAATELLTGSLGEGLTERAQNLVGNFAEMMAKDPVSFRELFSRAKTGEFWDALDKGGAESQFLGSLVGTGAGAVRAGVHQAQVRGRAADIAAARERAAQRQGAPAAPTAEVPPTLEGIGSDLARQLALDEAQRATLKRAQEAIASGDGEAALAAISDVLALPSALPAPLPSARAEAPVTVPTGERARPSPVGGAQEEQARRIVDSIAEHADRVERGDFWRDPLDVAGDEMLRQADTVGQAEAASERAKVAMDAGDYDAAMGHLAEALRFQGEAAVADPRLVRGQETAPRTPPAAEPAAPLLPQAPPQERRKAATPIFDWLDAKGQEIDQDRIDADPLTWSADEARYFGLIDAGTGLPNRKAFDVARKQNPTAREGRIDLDGLKQANDTYGHAVGDTYIETLAVVARQHGLRLARVGGDEFALLYDDEDAAIDERMRRARAQVESTRIPVEGLEEKDYPRHGGFSYGLGSDAASADAAAYADKRARKAARAAPLEVRRDGVGAGPGLPPARRTGGDGGPESGGSPGAPPAGSAPLPPPVAPAAPAARSATPNPAPREAVLSRTGREGEAFTADGERVGVKWAVADAFEGLVPSHEETGAGDLRPNPAFAQVLQPRDRGRAASEQQVDRISRELRPGALGESYYASDGAPIVGPDRLVESGNGRTLAVRRAYQTGRAEEYRRWLEEHAGEFGLTADQVREVKAPMLVRVRTTPTADRAELVKKFNVATVAKMSAAETARADADRLTPELLARFQPSEDGLAILAARNRDFVSGFLATVPENEKSELLDEDGQLNKDGRKRIENALLGKAFGEAPILERITEATDDNARLVSGALLNAAPAMATLKGAIEAGDVRADMDPTPAIVEAVQKLSWLRDEGGTVESYLQQQGLFADEMTPAGREVLKAFDTFKRSGKKLTSFLTAVAESAILEGDARQTDLFADAPPARLEDIVRAARRFAADGGQGGLFSGGEGLPLAPPDGPGPGGVPGGPADGPVDRPRVSRTPGRGDTGTDSRHVLLVERYARRLGQSWADAPTLEVVQNEQGLPDELRALAGDSRVEGVYVPREDRVYLVAGSLRSRSDVERVVLHEVMGHAGLRRLIGREDFGSLMDRIADSLPRDVEAKARAYGLDLKDREQRREAADEVLAEWASRPEAPPRAITRAIVALRGMLRRIFPSLRWTPDDVRALLARARRRVEEGESGKRTTEAPRFSRAADGEKRVQITELEGREFTTGERGVFLRARAWARANISGKDFLNRDTGLQIAVGRNAIDKMLSESATEKSRWPWHVEAIRSVPELIERAVLVEEGGDARGNDDFRSLRRFVAPLSTPDGVFRVKLTVKEYAGAKPGLYTYELTEVEVPGAGPRHQAGPHPITSRAGHDGDQGAVADMSLAELMGEGAAQDIRFSRAFDDEAPTEAEERVYRSLVERARERAGEAARAAARVREELADPGDILEARRDPELPTHSREIQNHIRPAGRKADVEPLLNKAEDAYQQLARRHYAVEKTSQRLGADRGPAHLDPGVVYELSAGHSARAEQMLEGNGGFRLGRNGEIEWTGNKAFSKILSALGPGRLNELRRYLVARRAIELHHRAPRQQGLLGDDERTIYSGISEAAAQQEVAGAPEDVKRAAEEVTALLDDALRYWAEAGGLSAEAVETIRDLNRSYVPFYRVFEGDDPARRSGRLVLPAQRGTALQAEQAVKKIWGGGADILDPLVAVADHVQRMIRAADVNRVGKALVDAAALNPEAAQGLVEEVTQPTTDPDATREGTAVQDSAGAYGVEVNDEAAAAISFLSDKKMSFANDRIRVWKDGKLREYRVEKSIGDSLRALGPQDVKLWAKLLSLPAQALREGVTKNPIFSLFNFLRDTGDASVQSTNGFRFFLDSTIGLAEAIRNGDLRKEWLAAGGGYSTLSGGGIRGAENALKEIAPKTTLQSTLWTLRHPLDLLGRLNRPFEEAARLGEYRLARMKGKSATEAALDSARITTNFTVHGSDAFWWGWLKASAFANPALQGADRAFRTVLEAPRGQKQTPQRALAAAANVVFKGLLNVGTLSALFYLLGDDDDEIKELRRTRAGATWWFARVPGTSVIVRIPKPFLWGQVFGTGIEAAIDRAKGENPPAFKEWRQEVLDMVWDGGVPIPSLMKLLRELSTNRSTFFQRPIVNRQLEGVEARYQANPSTSQVARKLGDAVNYAPAKIDYAIGSLTGSLGREAVRAGDLLLRDGSVSPPAPRLGDLPLVGRAFARTPDISNDSTETFYDELGKVREAVKTMKLLRKQDPEEARRRAPEYRRALLAERAYEATAERLADLRNAIERTNKAPDTTYSREEKRKRVDFLAVRMTDLARRVVARRLLEEPAR